PLGARGGPEEGGVRGTSARRRGQEGGAGASRDPPGGRRPEPCEARGPTREPGTRPGETDRPAAGGHRRVRRRARADREPCRRDDRGGVQSGGAVVSVSVTPSTVAARARCGAMRVIPMNPASTPFVRMLEECTPIV